MQLLEWQNLIFLVPIAIGALYLILLALGTSFGEHAGDTDLGHGPDVSVEHDVAVEHDVSIEHGAELDHGDVDHELEPGVFAALIGFLGVGKVPFSILLMSYCFVWGVVGLASLTLLRRDSAWAAIAIAAGGAVLITRHLAAGISRLVPSVASYHTPLRQLVGLRGEVLYEVTESSGMVRVRDERDNLRDVSCRVLPGAKSVPAGTRVVLQRYNSAARVFLVEA